MHHRRNPENDRAAQARALLAAAQAIRRRAAPIPTPSAWYRACEDPGAVFQRALPADRFALEPGGGFARGISAGPGQLQGHVSFTRSVQCRPEDRGKLLPALKAEFERLAREKGAAVGETPDGQGGNLTGFRLQYTAGGSYSQVSATLGEGKPAPSKLGVQSYPLTVKLEEWAS